uniref:Uncharacterized protein n=1 Tax=Oryza punctata TaxID=4537 RepID=A0A0E0KPS0_ORYPU
MKERIERNGDEQEASDASYRYSTRLHGYSDYRRSNNNNVNSCYNYNRKDGASNSTMMTTSFVGDNDNGEWWSSNEGACFNIDEEIWATLEDMLSINLTS